LCKNEPRRKLVFEKAVCLLYPNLTHIDPQKTISLQDSLLNK